MSGTVRARPFKVQFDGGKKAAFLYALDVCLSARPQKPIPQWAVTALGQALYVIAMAKAASWDDVLGKPHKKRKLAQLQKEYRLRYQVAKRVIELRRQRPKPRNIFQKVADENRISRQTCKRYFDREMNWLSKHPTF